MFEAWYSGPYEWAPESDTNSFSGMVKQAIKYLKGISDTNGTLEALNLGILATGATNLISIINNGDVACLPAITATESGNSGMPAQYLNASGSNITTQILSDEGYVYTNLLQPGQSTTITILLPDLSRTVTLEAFWNLQDPTGIVRDRLTIPLRPLLQFYRTTTNTLLLNWTNAAGAFVLQSQTNPLAVGLGSNWFNYPGSSNSPVIVPLDNVPSSIFFRLINL